MALKMKIGKLVPTRIYGYIIEFVIFKILEKVGIESKVAKVIRTIDKDKQDVDYRTYRQYMDRRHVFNKILDSEWITLTKDIGKDSLFLARHYIHQKKEEILQEGLTQNNNLSTVSAADLRALLAKLFTQMGYKVADSDGTDVDKISMILDLNDQKLLLYSVVKGSALETTAIENALMLQKRMDCKGVMVILLSEINKEAIDFANSNFVAIVSRERLRELIAQYLQENWI